MKHMAICNYPIWVIMLVILTIPCITSCQQQQITELKGLETEMDSIMKLYHTVGASVAIIKDHELIYSGGFGYRDLDLQIPADEYTVYGIGSCSKAFTSALFGLLEKEGRVHLDESPRKYIPELEFQNSEMNSNITIRHLLSHGTGLPNVSTESSAVFFTSENENEVINRLKYLEPEAAPDERFIYNNYVYALAGRLSERITGNSWRENLDHMIFDPLEMKYTYGHVTDAQRDQNFSLGYGVSRTDTLPIRVLPEKFKLRDAGGDIFSSVEDMSIWLKVWMEEGKYNQKPFFTKEYHKAAIGNQNLISRDSIEQTSRYYGFGWMNGMQEGFRKIEHSGGVSGYTSNVVYYPDEQLGIIVLTNQNTSGSAFAITNSIAQRFLGIEIASPPNEPYFSTVVAIEDPKTPTVINEEDPPSMSLDSLEGQYYHPGFGTIDITYDGATLYATFPFTKFRLQHGRGNNFQDYFTERKSEVVGNFLNFNFQTNIDLEVQGLRLNIAPNGIFFTKR